MGMLSWLFPSPADRVARARRYLDSGDPAEARLEVLEVDHPEAAAIVLEAETQLAQANLDAAVNWCRAGDDFKVHQHLELADQFHKGGLEEEFRTARREMRELRAARDAAEQRKKEEAAARLMSVDPLGVTGGPSWLDPSAPDDLYDADRDELEARLALLVEHYPEKLRPRVAHLGASFAQAVLALDDGKPHEALPELLALPDDEPLVQYERARAAHVLGDPRAASRALRRLDELGGHFQVGQTHTGSLLAQVLTEAGDAPGALRVLRDVRSREPKVGGFLFAQLLTMTGELPEAESVLVTLIKAHPRQMALYGMLAQVRLAGGHRTQAMQALEGGLSATCCTPGRCGYQKPDVGILRTLATLYLEDGIELERARELTEQAAALVQKPQWEDLYLLALAAHAERRPDAPALTRSLVQRTPPDDARQERIRAHLPVG